MNSITEKPWGSFEILKSGKKFLVKKIFVKPGGVLSLQSHEHRSEHWIVAEGEAEVTIDKKVINLKENDSGSLVLCGSNHFCFPSWNGKRRIHWSRILWFSLGNSRYVFFCSTFSGCSNSSYTLSLIHI